MNILEEILDHRKYIINSGSLGGLSLKFSKNCVIIQQSNNNENTYKIRVAEDCLNICDEEGYLRFFICESKKKELEFYEYGDIIDGPYKLEEI